MAANEHSLMGSLRAGFAPVLRILGLRGRQRSQTSIHDNAPWDDEPMTPGDAAAFAEAEANAKAGRLIPWEDVKREFDF